MVRKIYIGVMLLVIMKFALSDSIQLNSPIIKGDYLVCNQGVYKNYSLPIYYTFNNMMKDEDGKYQERLHFRDVSRKNLPFRFYLFYVDETLNEESYRTLNKVLLENISESELSNKSKFVTDSIEISYGRPIINFMDKKNPSLILKHKINEGARTDDMKLSCSGNKLIFKFITNGFYDTEKNKFGEIIKTPNTIIGYLEVPLTQLDSNISKSNKNSKNQNFPEQNLNLKANKSGEKLNRNQQNSENKDVLSLFK